MCAPDVIFGSGCLEEISKTVRNNARSAVKRAEEITLYCGKMENRFFSLDDFEQLSDHVGILPYGISFTEKQILEVLNNCGSCTLTGLAAKLGLSKTALQRDHELYLLNKSLIEIDGKRKITDVGIEVLQRAIRVYPYICQTLNSIMTHIKKALSELP